MSTYSSQKNFNKIATVTCEYCTSSSYNLQIPFLFSICLISKLNLVYYILRLKLPETESNHVGNTVSSQHRKL